MTDLEITRLCAEAMGLPNRATEPREEEFAGIYESRVVLVGGIHQATVYRPLHDDAQAMALVKRFRLKADPHYPTYGEDAMRMWLVEGNASLDLNRAICECVAKMQAAKAAASE